MTMHLQPEYRSDLAGKGGWLTTFSIFVVLAVLAYLRSAAAGVVSGGAGMLMSLTLAALLLIALIGLLLRKRWAYYGFLLIGGYLLVSLGLTMLAAPDRLWYTDWKFDLPVSVEWLLALAWGLYLLRSRRVYSVLFGAGGRT